MKKMKHVVIVGGGIAGLSAAYDLHHAGVPVTVVEASGFFGGKVQTVREGEYLIEQGPDSIFSTKPWALDLIIELGLADELIEPRSTEFSILVKGKLHTVPRALATMMPTASAALEKVGFLGAAAKKRFLHEKEVDQVGEDDPSIATFFRHRFGRKFSELVAEPLLAGIHAGDPEKLSMKALYPGYLGMERDYGSLSKAMISMKRPVGELGQKVGFLALRNGMGSLIQKLVAELEGARLIHGTRANEISRQGRSLAIRLETGEELAADHLILAVPAYVTARLLESVAPLAAAKLGNIRFISTAVATLAYPSEAFPSGLHGNGFLVPFSEPSAITGCTWSSNKWERRAPGGAVLLRAFMGREGGLDVDGKTDGELLSEAEAALRKIIRPVLPPTLRRIDRWPKAMAQYDIGHTLRLAEIENGLADLPIDLIGSSYRGNGIPDCVRQGREAAARLLASKK